MASEDIKKNLKKKRNKELRQYFSEIVKEEGLASAIRRTWKYLIRRHGKKRGRFMPKKSELAKQREADVLGWPRISICVPVYNTSRKYFDELLHSVVNQSYQDWELCIANASDEGDVVRELIGKYNDKRILCEDIENQGISVNTNHAVQMASGQYVAFLDHDDLLSPNALYEVARAVARTESGFIYSDEALFTNDWMSSSVVGHFKPDYSPQYLLNCNYITHFTAIRRDLVNRVGGFRKEFDGAQDHDLFLRVLELLKTAYHIPKVLYYWRRHEGSTSAGIEAKPYAAQAAKKAINEHLERTMVLGDAIDGKFPSTYKVEYAIKGRPLVSIIIPNKDHLPDLDRCIQSIYAKTSYLNFEVIIVENGSTTIETFAYYQRAVDIYQNLKVMVYEESREFNFSKICNFGRKGAKGNYLLFLNNDTEVINNDWLKEMLMLCQLENAAVVGAMLYYPNDTVQHGGIIVGLGGYAGHSHKYAFRDKSGYMFRQSCVQELSAVTGACMLIRSEAFDKVGGFDEGFAVAYNDVDLCLRVRRRGESVLFTPYAELYHYESASRGLDLEGEALERFTKEQDRLWKRYGEELLHDPFYSPYLTLDREDFSEADILPEKED